MIQVLLIFVQQVSGLTVRFRLRPLRLGLSGSFFALTFKMKLLASFDTNHVEAQEVLSLQKRVKSRSYDWPHASLHGACDTH